MKISTRVCLLLFSVCVSFALAQPSPQDQPQQQRRGPGGREFRGTGGQITEISGSTLKIKQQNGAMATVTVNADTRFRKDRQEAKLSDFKVGDNIMVGGDSTGENSWTAQIIRSAPSQADMQQAQQRMKDAMGKTIVVGDVKSIDAPKLTVERVDGVEQTIEADENTSIRRGGGMGGGGDRLRQGTLSPSGNSAGGGGESITLQDIKAGDMIVARGELKDGNFAPASINVMDPEMVRRMKEAGATFFGGPGPRGDRGSQAPGSPQATPPENPKQ